MRELYLLQSNKCKDKLLKIKDWKVNVQKQSNAKAVDGSSQDISSKIRNKTKDLVNNGKKIAKYLLDEFKDIEGQVSAHAHEAHSLVLN